MPAKLWIAVGWKPTLMGAGAEPCSFWNGKRWIPELSKAKTFRSQAEAFFAIKIHAPKYDDGLAYQAAEKDDLWRMAKRALPAESRIKNLAVHHQKCDCAVETRCALCDSASEMLCELRTILVAIEEDPAQIGGLAPSIVKSMRATIAKAERTEIK